MPYPQNLEVAQQVEATLRDAGVDRIAVGSITKHLRAVDVTMRISREQPAAAPSPAAG